MNHSSMNHCGLIIYFFVTIASSIDTSANLIVIDRLTHPNSVAVGTYQLDEAAGRRDGNVQLYRVALEEHPRFRAHGDQEDDKADDIGSNSVGNKSVKCGGSNTDGKGDECTSRACLVPCGQLEMPSGGVLDCKVSPY